MATAASAARKRKIVDDSVAAKVEEACLKKQIRSLRGNFEKEGERELLVFPGLNSCMVQRPPKQLVYCGRSKFTEVLDLILAAKDKGKRAFLLTGPKGGGKSCILRALALDLIRVFDTWEDVTMRVVCFWYLDAEQSMLQQVQDALLFTFSDDEEAVKNISGMETWEDAAAFLEARKRLGEEIWLITDGEECLDSCDGEKLRETARTWLDEISKPANFIIKALPPGAKQLRRSVFQGSPAVYILDSLLDEVERNALIEGTALEVNLAVYPERWDMFDEIAGCHPLSVSLLISYCNEAIGFNPSYIRSTGTAIREKYRNHRRSLKNPNTGPAATATSVPSVDAVALPEPLLDDASWDRLVQSFKQDDIFKDMRKSVRGADVQKNELVSFQLLGANFPAYYAKDDFCTPFIRKIHMEEASSRLLSAAYVNEAWSVYMRERLRDERGMNWAEVGWLCENFVSQVVQNKGLKLATGVNQPVNHFRGMQVIRLEGSEPARPETSNWKDGTSQLLLPDKYFFRDVDFVLLAVVGGVMHVYGGQVAVNPDNHRKTERRFVMPSNIKRWVEQVACEVHYVYLCPSLSATSLEEVKCENASGKHYVLHTTSLSECFEGIGVEEKELLKQLADKRKEAMEKRKADKKKAAQNRWADMDPRVMRQTDLEYLKRKGVVHGISFEKATKEAMVKQLMQAKKMDGCGINGKDCPSCVLLASQLKERKRIKL